MLNKNKVPFGNLIEFDNLTQNDPNRTSHRRTSCFSQDFARLKLERQSGRGIRQRLWNCNLIWKKIGLKNG
jgi:hypothetical protein